MDSDEISFDPPLPLPLDETAGRLFDRLCRAHAALLKAQAALNPLSGFLRKRPPKMERYLESVRQEIREAMRD
jgi:hypothetical protein